MKREFNITLLPQQKNNMNGLEFYATSALQGIIATGHVAIMGAGPGDPELITIKGMRLLQEADVILYDRLVNEDLLQYAPHAELVFCGKAPGKHAMSQTEINAALIHYAYLGKKVVRLKGGDPFVFGRGGEEALALAEAGVHFDIIPGITSAIGAAAAANIPLTHRNVATSFACVTGYCCDENNKQVRWDLLAHSVDTLAIYMGVGSLAQVQEALLQAGKSSLTPIAFIEQGTTVNECIYTGTLSHMCELARVHNIKNPSLIIIGESVRIREQLQSALMQAMKLRHIV